MSDSDTRVDAGPVAYARGGISGSAARRRDLPVSRRCRGRASGRASKRPGMNTDFLAGILVARMLEGMQFAVGPTIAARRAGSRSIGGFNRLKDYLAEDFAMGNFAAEAGHGVILSSLCDRASHRQYGSAAQCGPPFAMGAQHAALAAIGLHRPVVHHAHAAGRVPVSVPLRNGGRCRRRGDGTRHCGVRRL